MSGTLNVAVIQSPAELKGPKARLTWLTQTLEEHANLPSDLIVLPELYQSGYNIGSKVAEYAEPFDGPFARAVIDLAKKHSTAILYGYSERQADTLFNSAQCINKNGQVIGHHRKLLLPPGFEGEHFFPGNSCELFTLGEFNIGILVCYDVEFPESVRHVALAGADLVLVPTALGKQWGVVAEKLVPTRAFENGVYVCYANSCGQENGMDFFGGSCIIAPDGMDLARAKSSPEFLYSCVKKSAVAIAQDRLPYHKDRHKLPWI
jgi:predicted amidohydrolase